MGDDELYGGAGDDLIIQSGSGTQHYDGGDGIDTYLMKLTDWISPDDFIGEVDLVAGFSGAHLDHDHELNDTVVNVEHVLLEGDIDFVIRGDDEDNNITSAGGDDILDGRGGNNVLGGLGNDYYCGDSRYAAQNSITDIGGEADTLGLDPLGKTATNTL